MSIIRTFGVFELDSGNSFNGEYIPHSFETNWYYGPVPSQYTQMHGLRMYGLSKGQASISMSALGAQTDFFFEGDTFSDPAVPADLPKVPANITSDFNQTTHKIDIQARGLAIQLRVEGSGEFGTSTPEPGHICQAIVMHTSPEGAYDH